MDVNYCFYKKGYIVSLLAGVGAFMLLNNKDATIEKFEEWNKLYRKLELEGLREEYEKTKKEVKSDIC